MKKIVRFFASALCVVSIILAGAENLDGSCNLVWTLGWLSVALTTGLYLKHSERYERGR